MTITQENAFSTFESLTADIFANKVPDAVFDVNATIRNGDMKKVMLYSEASQLAQKIVADPSQNRNTQEAAKEYLEALTAKKEIYEIEQNKTTDLTKG